MANQVTQYTPCLSINVRHHEVEGTGAVLSDMMECIDVALVNVEV